MLKKHLVFFPIHFVVACFLLLGAYMGSGAPSPTPFEPVKVWAYLMMFFFPVANIGGLYLLYAWRGKKNNFKAFLISLPIHLIPYIALLLLMLRM